MPAKKHPSSTLSAGGPAAGSSWPTIRLQSGRDKLARAFQPWVFSGALLDRGAAGRTPPGAEPLLPGAVRVADADGGFVAWGQFQPASKIALRLCSWDEGELPTATWLRARLEEAIALRLGSPGRPGIIDGAATTACRLVYSESDRLPGLIVERLGDWLAVQSDNAACDAWMPFIAEALPEAVRSWLPGLRGIIERSDGDGRALEGLPPRHGLLWGEDSPGPVTVRENGLEFLADPRGQKAGFYTDQRDNRALVAPWAAGRRVLDVCCYSGGFSAAARAAGARDLTLVDASADALELARRNLGLNAARAPGGQDSCPAEFVQGDAFQTLRDLRRDGRGPYGLIILDPPKLAPSRSSLERALHGYKDLNLQAFKLLEPGGVLASFSCSGLVSADDLRQAIAFAAKDAGRRARVIRPLFQAGCHPVPLGHPDALYLKGFLLVVD